MDHNAIRRSFLSFFKEKGHEIFPSASVVNTADPELLFVNAGMNPFKEYFLGTTKAPASRIANTQKCLRISGKHNDLEAVGLDTFHLTFFEMLGNWSFGDYYKKEAITWAWQLLTSYYNISSHQLYITIFKGDDKDKVPFDKETFDIWKCFVPESQIFLFGKEDNFWEMGEAGPCGPCTEIHIDLRSSEARRRVPVKSCINCSHPEVIELWNLVFIQYYRRQDGSLRRASEERYVDTGMGLERLAMVLQGKRTVYETDLFSSILTTLSVECKVEYGTTQQTDIALRVVADHLRALCFMIADHLQPSRTKAGYVLRRLLRRALRYGHTFLKRKEPFLYQFVPTLAAQYQTGFPSIQQQEKLIQHTIYEEETLFLRTLAKGLTRLSKAMQSSLSKDTHSAPNVLSGEFVFELYDTYGFPIDLTGSIAKEHDQGIDLKSYRQILHTQRLRSKQATTQNKEDWKILNPSHQTCFVGYDTLDIETKILRYRSVSSAQGKHYELVLAETPFYAEAGGQLGDQGILYVGEEKLSVRDTQKREGIIVHILDQLPKTWPSSIHAQVTSSYREAVSANHTATHLLHAALREVLGEHVEQRGSRVSAESVRFDFSHYRKLTTQELQAVEVRINEKIRENIPLKEARDVPLQVAQQQGAKALFGEKYTERVRVITFDDQFSVELCAGTHVRQTGAIGLCKIAQERALSSGIRRIEVLTATPALSYINDQLHTFSELLALLKYPKNAQKTLTDLLTKQKELQSTLNHYHAQMLEQQKKDLLSKARSYQKGTVLIEEMRALREAQVLRTLTLTLSKQIQAPFFILLAGKVEQKAYFSLLISKDLVEKHKLDASKLCKEWAENIQGSGGGQVFFAMAGGPFPKGLKTVVKQGRQFAEKYFTQEV